MNADVFWDTGTGSPLSTNMFAYCQNNPVNCFDPNGLAAYWLQDYYNVAGQGHTSLLIQQSKGKWWYFFWGMGDIQLLYFGAGTLNDVNKFLHGKNKWKYNFYKGNSYTCWKLIKGDFTYCLDYIFYNLMGHSRKKEKKIRSYSMKYVNKKYKNKAYDLFTNNCVQVSMRVLLQGRFAGNNNIAKRNMLYNLLYGGCIIPNDIYFALVRLGFFK